MVIGEEEEDPLFEWKQETLDHFPHIDNSTKSFVLLEGMGFL
jgi:hypothetical protein